MLAERATTEGGQAVSDELSSTTVTQSVPVVDMPRAEWSRYHDPEGALYAINPVKGTWCLLSAEEQGKLASAGKYVRALLSCPHCAHTGIVPGSFDVPMDNGHGKPNADFQCQACGLVCRLVLRRWDTRKLFCAAYETRAGETIAAHKEYLHAVDLEEAQKFFWSQHTPILEVTKLVGIAPVVGFHVPDGKNDRKLIV